jgi:hypothetical protein
MNYFKRLHQQAIGCARRYKRAESDLLEIIQKIDASKSFLKLEYPSMFQYCVGALRLSESTAYNFITVSRKAAQIPEIKVAINKGALTLSKARKITSVINKENK